MAAEFPSWHVVQAAAAGSRGCAAAGVGPEDRATAAHTDRAQGHGHMPGICHQRQAAVFRLHRWQHWGVDRQGKPPAGVAAA